MTTLDSSVFRRQVAVHVFEHLVSSVALVPLALASLAAARFAVWLLLGSSPRDKKRRETFEKNLQRHLKPKTATKPKTPTLRRA